MAAAGCGAGPPCLSLGSCKVCRARGVGVVCVGLCLYILCIYICIDKYVYVCVYVHRPLWFCVYGYM